MPFSYLAFQNEEHPDAPPRTDPVFEPPRLTALRKPVAASTIGVLTSCGVRHPDQSPLGATNDLTYRLVDRAWALADLVFDHETPVRVWADEDLNVAYPRDRLLELEAEGAIGRLAPRAVSIVGSITRSTELMQETVPKIKQEFDALGVDLVLLLPF